MSRKIRKPKNLKDYTSAEEAAAGLEDMARSIRAHSAIRPLVRYSVRLSYWNHEWREIQPGVICLSVNYGNAPLKIEASRGR